ncbi:IS1182 family transposase [Aceticella autotrophica]|uniref:IS1182 family transposase n=1 Tax=Aceticella autotrophica TaxID=2755338 RepID=A0A975AW54_9THEO|nr:IS1182 family transposase [Aceticella autotrophica]QSZ27574.1 IS1182 family transposase [Aceticella autotrophica]
MIGKADRQMSFSDYWLLGKISEVSYYHRLRTWVFNNLNEEMFQPLFSYYGRESISPVYTFTAMLIQFEKGYSDREMEEESRFDDRIKYALTAPRDFDGIDAVTLCDHRKRLFNSEIGKEIFIKTISQAKEVGLFNKDNLHIIDSFMIWGSCARQDTYTMIYQGIKMVLRFMKFYEMEDASKKILKRTDYEENIKKPKIAWENEKEKAKLLEELVKDALLLVENIKTKKDIKDDLKKAIELLERIALQDVEITNDGHVKMIKGTAKDRIISVVDDEMRHGRKTSSKLSDGYKAEIITGGEKGSVVVGIEVDGANIADGEHMSDLIEQSRRNGVDIDKLYGDCAYSDFEEIEKRKEEGTDFCIRVPEATNPSGGFSKEEFKIDLEKGTVECPNGHIKQFDTEKTQKHEQVTVKFRAEECNDCPLKDQCTKSKKGRTINIHPYEKEIQEQREYQKTDEFKEDYAKRPNVERNISELTRHGGRKGRYRGKLKIRWQMIMVAINNNIKVIMKHISKICNRQIKKGEVCPKTA